MAFEWKWQPTLDEELSRAAKAKMEGYHPLSNPSNNYGMVLGNGAGPNVSQIAAAQMAGYGSPTSSMAGYVPSRTPAAVNAPAQADPSYGLGGEGGQQRALMFGANNYGQGQAYTDKIAALQDEYQQNEARIAEIESKIAGLKGQISQKAKARDELDMKLAANRARIGDIGSSFSHQSAITNRKYQEAMRKLEAQRNNGSEADAKKAVIDAYTELAYAPDEKTQALAQYKVDQALEEYKKKSGKDFGVNPIEAKKGGAKSGDVASTLERAQGKFSASLDKYGRPTDAAKAEALKDAEGLPYSKELQEWIDKVRNTETQEERSGKDAKVSKANQAAVDEAVKEFSGFDMKDGDSKTYTASNKKVVTVKKSGGKLTFTCGKAVKTK